MTPLAAYILLFTAVGIGFIFVHLVAGKLIRPNRPDAEKGTIYECGEPTIGSAWIQFDLRFYVVALLFVIFDVEVAFFFPWAEVFGKANAIVSTEKPTRVENPTPEDLEQEAREYREYAVKILELASPASSSEQQSKEIQPYRELSKLTPVRLKEMKAEQEKAQTKVKAKGKLSREESLAERYDGALEQKEFEKNREAARELAMMAFLEVLLFFGILLVGFAYLWRRGDLAWVRSTLAEQAPPPVVETAPPPTVKPASREHAAVSGHS